MRRLQAWAVARRPVAIAWLAPARVGHSLVRSRTSRGPETSNATSHGACRRRSISRASWNDSAIAPMVSSATY